MSKQYPGGLITKTPVTPSGPYETSTASGVWTINQAAYWAKQGLWPTVGNIAPDPYFNYVTMLLHGDGSASGTTSILPFNSDASTNNFNVAINGDARSNNFNPYQAGYYSNSFNGSSGVTVSSTSSQFGFTGDFTWEAWINPSALPSSGGNYSIICSRGSVASNSAFQFLFGNSSGTYQITGTISISSSDSNLVWNISGTPSIGTWYHVAIVRSGTSVQAYWNGTAIGSAQTASGTTNTPTVNPTIGFRGGSYNDLFFNGYISNFRMVGSAVYTGNFTPSTTPLTAISGTRILTCQSNRFIDNSTNVFSLTAYSSPQVAPAQPFTLPSSVATYGSGYFGGTAGSYLETAYNSALDASTGPFTYEAWLNPSTTTNKQYLGGSVTGAFFAFIGSGTIFVGRNNIAVDFTSSATVVTNQWNHVVIVRNASNNIAIFINGSRQYYAASNTNNYGLASNSLRVGVATTGSSYEYNGYITDVKIAKSALYDPTASTITVPTSPLTAGSAGLLTTQYNGAGNNSGFKDSSINNYPITRNGSITQGTFTPYGSNWSCYLDGSGDQLTTPSQASFRIDQGNWTWEGWVYPTSLRDTNVLISLGTGGSAVWYTVSVGLTNGAIQMGTNNGTWNFIGIYASSANVIKANQWNHFALVYSGTTLYFFANGVAVGSQASPYLAPGQSGTLYMGSYYNNYNNDGSWYGGYVSNLRFVKGTAVYSGSTYTVPTAPLTAITNTSLLAFQSNRFIDTSANAYTLTRVGDTSVQRFSPFSPTTAYSTSVISGSGCFFGASNSLQTPYGTCPVINDFSASGWVYRTSVPGYQQTFIAIGLDGAGRVGFFWTGSNFEYNIYGSSTVTIDGSGSMPVGAWTYVVLTRTGSSLSLYYNGTLKATVSLGTAFSASSGRAMSWMDGTIGYATNLRFDTAAYSSPTTVPTAPLSYTANTNNLLNFTNAGILDNAMMNDLETVGNAQVSTKVKKFGNASMYFDGAGDWVSCPASPQWLMAGDWTIECWIYPNSVTGVQVLVETRNRTTNASPCMYLNGTNLVIDTGTASVVSAGTITISTWQHVAATRSGNSWRIFINGTQVGSTTTNTTSYTTAYGCCIGSSYYNEHYNGYIDDLRITKGYARYTANFTPPTSAFPDR